MFVRQKTLKSPVSGAGVGLHTGEKISITLCPADSGTGIVLKRTDVVNGGAIIPVTWRNVVGSTLATAVGNDYGIHVSTVEHMMAALAGCEIDNVIIEIDGPEMPIMDGSAEPFVRLIELAGVVEQDAARRGIKVLKPVTVGDATRSLSLLPGDGFNIEFEIEFESGAIARQDLAMKFADGAFHSQISRARTFGFEHEVAAMQSAGFALGGSLANAVVISGDKVLNEEGLRYEDEFVRHKVLDCIGDLYLAGAPLVGHVYAKCSGHALNHDLLNALLEDDSAWRYTELAVDDASYGAPVEEEQRATA